MCLEFLVYHFKRGVETAHLCTSLTLNFMSYHGIRIHWILYPQTCNFCFPQPRVSMDRTQTCMSSCHGGHGNLLGAVPKWALNIFLKCFSGKCLSKTCTKSVKLWLLEVYFMIKEVFALNKPRIDWNQLCFEMKGWKMKSYL